MTISPAMEPADLASPARPRSAWAVHVALVALLLATACVRFWRSPYEAGGRLVTPDGAEYAVAAHRLATLGTLDIDVGGVRYPSRYPPMFSAVLLAPVYAVAPGEIGNGIVVVLAFALLLAASAYVVGWRVAGAYGAVFAASAVVHHDLLASLARTIMSDLPVAALAVAGMALFLRMRAGAGPWTWLAAGVIVAVAAGLRPLAGALLLPFPGILVFDRRRLVPRLVGLLTPIVLLAVVMAGYNHTRFGAWWRTGYHFWCPIPYEFPHLTWSTRYFWDNADLLGRPQLALVLGAGAIAAWVLLTRKNGPARQMVGYTAAAALPISVAHLYYFHPEPRFHAVLVALCCVSAGVAAATVLPAFVRARPWGAVVLAVVGLALARPPRDVYGSSRVLERHLAAYVPPGATIVTLADPVPLDPTVLRAGSRQWVPVWRRQNYAGHAIAPRPIELPRGAVNWPGSHRTPILMQAGAREAVPWTATERPDLLEARVKSGPGVYLDAGSVPEGSEPYKQLGKRFVLHPVDPRGLVLRLTLRGGPTTADSPEGELVRPGD